MVKLFAAVMVTDPLTRQPMLSVTVTVYVPGGTPMSCGPIWPVFQRYVSGGKPPEAQAVACPVLKLEQSGDKMGIESRRGCLISTVRVVAE
jgi:hypothetical protein